MANMDVVGTHPRVMKWIRQFLHKKTYQVRTNNQYSKVFTKFCGLPQGWFVEPYLIWYLLMIPQPQREE